MSMTDPSNNWLRDELRREGFSDGKIDLERQHHEEEESSMEWNMGARRLERHHTESEHMSGDIEPVTTASGVAGIIGTIVFLVITILAAFIIVWNKPLILYRLDALRVFATILGTIIVVALLSLFVRILKIIIKNQGRR